mgnify:CR=1 FL=1
MSFTYSTLKSAIENYADNTETTFVANLDNFIKAAEQRILNSIDLQYFRKNVTGTVTSGKEFLLEKDVNYIQSVNPNSATTGVPKYYAYFDINNFILAPTPSANAVAELHYFYRPASLTAAGDSGTTWLSTNAPNAMLYGSLVEAYIYMKGEPDVMKSYTDRFMESLVRLKDYGEARENSDAYRRGLPTRERS